MLRRENKNLLLASRFRFHCRDDAAVHVAFGEIDLAVRAEVEVHGGCGLDGVEDVGLVQLGGDHGDDVGVGECVAAGAAAAACICSLRGRLLAQGLVVGKRGVDARLRLQEVLLRGLGVDGLAVVDGCLLQVLARLGDVLG